MLGRSTEADLQKLAGTARLCEYGDRDGKLQQLVTVMYFETINHYYYYCGSEDSDGKEMQFHLRTFVNGRNSGGKHFEGVQRLEAGPQNILSKV